MPDTTIDTTHTNEYPARNEMSISVLVSAYRRASERFIQSCRDSDGEHMDHSRRMQRCVTRLTELGHDVLTRQLLQEHGHRSSLYVIGTTIDLDVKIRTRIDAQEANL